MKNFLFPSTIFFLFILLLTVALPGYSNNLLLDSAINKPLPDTQSKAPSIVCHNCYKKTLAETLHHISSAIDAGAAVIELDIIEYKNTIKIGHGKKDDYVGPALASVFARLNSKNKSLILFIEIKSNRISNQFSRLLIKLLSKFTTAGPGHTIYIRSFHDTIITQLYSARNISQFSNRIMLSKLYKINWFIPVTEFYDNIKLISPKVSMVEFNLYARELAGLLDYAKSLKLKTNLWTITHQVRHYLQKFPDKLDFITIDGNKKVSQLENIRKLHYFAHLKNNGKNK